MERGVLVATAEGHHLTGTSLTVVDGVPHEIRYSVLVDHKWRTRTVGAHVQGGPSDRRMALHSDGAGTWSASDQPVLDLFGAEDIELAWSAATFTLPLRRLALDVGAEREVMVACVAFPDHVVSRRRRRYARVGNHRYRYESETTSTEITVDADGFLVSYPERWRAVAAR